MNEHEIRSLFPTASPDFIRRNTDPAVGDPGAPPKPQRTVRHGALGKKKVQGSTRRRFLVRVETVRKRLLDEDNIIAKFHVDLLRYSGVISGDEAHTTKIETTQRKAAKGEEETVVIEVFEFPCS